MVEIGNNIYIYGGYDDDKNIYLNDFYKIEKNDSTTYNSTKIDLIPNKGYNSNIPLDTYGHSMVAIGSNIYIFGGTSSSINFIDNFYKIDTTTNISTKIVLQSIDGDSTNKPSARYGHSMVAIGTNIYIFGGISWNDDDDRSELYNDCLLYTSPSPRDS